MDQLSNRSWYDNFRSWVETAAANSRSPRASGDPLTYVKNRVVGGLPTAERLAATIRAFYEMSHPEGRARLLAAISSGIAATTPESAVDTGVGLATDMAMGFGGAKALSRLAYETVPLAPMLWLRSMIGKKSTQTYLPTRLRKAWRAEAVKRFEGSPSVGGNADWVQHDPEFLNAVQTMANKALGRWVPLSDIKSVGTSYRWDSPGPPPAPTASILDKLMKNSDVVGGKEGIGWDAPFHTLNKYYVVSDPTTDTYHVLDLYKFMLDNPDAPTAELLKDLLRGRLRNAEFSGVEGVPQALGTRYGSAYPVHWTLPP